MWVLFAFGSAFFAGITAILAKCGIKNTDSDVATAIRTIVVLAFSWLMVLISGSFSTIIVLDTKTWVFLVLSGLSTGASWLCYFKALQLGDINKVVPIDKSSTVLTILLAFIFLIEKKKSATSGNSKGRMWLIYALLSTVFASLTAILGKVGIDVVESNLGTAIRTCVVLIMAWLIVLIKRKQSAVKKYFFKRINIYLSFRPCNGRLMAVLLQGTS